MKTLLLIAHGSRREQSNIEVAQLADNLKNKLSNDYQAVHHAFLELASPLIPDVIKYCVDDGATSILVLPYFLNSGRHVHEDIPNIINEARKSRPNISINIASHIGASEIMVDVLMGTINASLN